MDNQERAQLLLDQEQTQTEITRLKRELHEHGDDLARLSQQLHSGPENIVFPNAPAPLGNIPPELMRAQGHIWEKVSDMTGIAQKIQSYRAALKKLNHIQSRLQSR